MKFIYCADLHGKLKNPRSRLDNYSESWLEKIKDKELLKEKVAEMHDVGHCKDLESFAKALKKILDTTSVKDLRVKDLKYISCPKGPKGVKGTVGKSPSN